GNCAAVTKSAYGPTNSAPPLLTRPPPVCCSSPTTPEIGCHLALGWRAPERVLDLFPEFRNCTNGIPTVSGASLLGALDQGPPLQGQESPRSVPERPIRFCWILLSTSAGRTARNDPSRDRTPPSR